VGGAIGGGKWENTRAEVEPKGEKMGMRVMSRGKAVPETATLGKTFCVDEIIIRLPGYWLSLSKVIW